MILVGSAQLIVLSVALSVVAQVQPQRSTSGPAATQPATAPSAESDIKSLTAQIRNELEVKRSPMYLTLLRAKLDMAQNRLRIPSDDEQERLVLARHRDAMRDWVNVASDVVGGKLKPTDPAYEMRVSQAAAALAASQWASENRSRDAITRAQQAFLATIREKINNSDGVLRATYEQYLQTQIELNDLLNAPASDATRSLTDDRMEDLRTQLARLGRKAGILERIIFLQSQAKDSMDAEQTKRLRQKIENHQRLLPALEAMWGAQDAVTRLEREAQR